MTTAATHWQGGDDTKLGLTSRRTEGPEVKGYLGRVGMKGGFLMRGLEDLRGCTLEILLCDHSEIVGRTTDRTAIVPRTEHPSNSIR